MTNAGGIHELHALLLEIWVGAAKQHSKRTGLSIGVDSHPPGEHMPLGHSQVVLWALPTAHGDDLSLSLTMQPKTANGFSVTMDFTEGNGDVHDERDFVRKTVSEIVEEVRGAVPGYLARFSELFARMLEEQQQQVDRPSAAPNVNPTKDP